MGLAGNLGEDALDLVPLVVHQPGQAVDLVDSGVGDGHGGGVAGGHAVGPVGAFYNQGGAEPAGVQQLLHLVIAPVIAAHEADLHQMLAGGHLRVHHGLAVGGGVGQGLLAEDRLAGLDGGQDGVLVELAGGGDHHGVDVRVVDGLVEVRVGLGARPGNLRALFHALLEHVADRHDLGAPDAVLNAFNVLPADHAAANQADVEFHNKFLLLI